MPISLYKIAEYLDLTPSDTLFLEIITDSDTIFVVRFADRKIHLCIYYKFERFEMISGGIIMWHGSLAAIPPDYALCDGDNGTPDLREKFVVGTANGVDPGGGGGSVNHNHDFTGDGHRHTGQHPGPLLQDFPGNDTELTIENVTGTTDNEDGRPPFYEIAYIMKL